MHIFFPLFTSVAAVMQSYADPNSGFKRNIEESEWKMCIGQGRIRATIKVTLKNNLHKKIKLWTKK